MFGWSRSSGAATPKSRGRPAGSSASVHVEVAPTDHRASRPNHYVFGETKHQPASTKGRPQAFFTQNSSDSHSRQRRRSKRDKMKALLGDSEEENELVASARTEALSGPLRLTPFMQFFADPDAEVKYRKSLWVASRMERVIGSVYLILFCVPAIMLQGVRVGWGTAAPGAVLWLCGTAILSVSWHSVPPLRLLRHWNLVSSIAVCMLLYGSILNGPFAVCESHSQASFQCKAISSGHLYYLESLLLLTAGVTNVFFLYAHWSATLVLLVFTGAYIRAVVPHLGMMAGQAAAVLGATMISLLFAARIWQRHHRTAYAQAMVARAALGKAARATLRRQEFQAMHRTAMKEKLAFENVLRYVCHEIRNPLHGVLGTLEHYADCEAEEMAQDMKVCLTAGRQMAAILNDVLDLGQLQRGQMKLDPCVVNTREFIRRCVHSVSGISTVPIHAFISSRLPETMTFDELRVSQVLTNGLSNACKATSVGTIKIFMYCSPDSGVLCMEVWDCGPGLRGRQGDDLFAPYQQGSMKTSRRVSSRFKKGTGLGLAIAKRFIDLMGGCMRLVERSDGTTGARFQVVLPRSVAVEGVPMQQVQVEEATMCTPKAVPELENDCMVFPPLPVQRSGSRRQLGRLADADSSGSGEGQGQGGSDEADEGEQEAKAEAWEEMATAAGALPGMLSSSLPPELQAVSKKGKKKGKKERGKVSSTGPYFGKHMIIVDDETLNTSVLRRFANKLGFTTTTMSDGRELLQLSRTAPGLRGGLLYDSVAGKQVAVDVVLLDIIMVHTNGEDVCAQLREKGVRTKVVAATGNGLSDDLLRYKAKGFNSVLLKPFNLAGFKGIMNEVFTPPGAQGLEEQESKSTPPGS